MNYKQQAARRRQLSSGPLASLKNYYYTTNT
jgi:hypothetical protein